MSSSPALSHSSIKSKTSSSYSSIQLKKRSTSDQNLTKINNALNNFSSRERSSTDVKKHQEKNLGLHAACSSGNLGLVKFALDHGQSINSVFNGMQPIHVAAGAGHVYIVEYLLSRGADINARRLQYHQGFNNNSLTNISTTASHSHTSPFPIPSSLSSIHSTFSSTMTIASDTSMSSSASNSSSDQILGIGFGSTPLHFAVAQENLQVVEFLLGFDAYPNFKDEFGSTPLDLSITKKNQQIANLIIDAMNRRGIEIRKRTAKVAKKETKLRLMTVQDKQELKNSAAVAHNVLNPNFGDFDGGR